MSEEKTVYLIRHAQSEQNIQLGRVKNGEYIAGLFGAAMIGLDAPLSDHGKKQLLTANLKLKTRDWIPSSSSYSPKPELIVHSPYIRAKDTAVGIFNSCPLSSSMLELPWFHERTLFEYIPYLGYIPFDTRIQQTNDWLKTRQEKTIAMVGHGQLFKRWLNAPHSPANVEALECVWSPENGGKIWIKEDGKARICLASSQGQGNKSTDISIDAPAPNHNPAPAPAGPVMTVVSKL
jgi:phosphohistidine phosphatase SixA